MEKFQNAQMCALRDRLSLSSRENMIRTVCTQLFVGGLGCSCNATHTQREVLQQQVGVCVGVACVLFEHGVATFVQPLEIVLKPAPFLRAVDTFGMSEQCNPESDKHSAHKTHAALLTTRAGCFTI